MASQIKVDQITDSSGNLPVDMPNGAKVFGENINPFSGSYKNKIINGNFDIWQRGVSQTTSGYGSVDRWNCENNGTTKTASQQTFALGQTDVPGNPKYYMRHVVNSVSGVNNHCVMDQRIEYVKTLAGKTATLSFWAKADSNKNIAIEFRQSFGTGGTPSSAVGGIGSQLVALTTSWQKYILTIELPNIDGKILGTDGNDCLVIYFWFDSGSNYATRSANLGQQSGTFDIAQVQLEEGEVATAFEQRHITDELALCQRYYEEYYGWTPRPGASNSSSFSTEGFFHWNFQTQKRAVPTITGPSTINGGNLIDTDSAIGGMRLQFSATTAGGTYTSTDISADAEL